MDSTPRRLSSATARSTLLSSFVEPRQHLATIVHALDDFKAQIALDSNSHFGWERGLSKGATD
jgi:hypothetical protein